MECLEALPTNDNVLRLYKISKSGDIVSVTNLGIVTSTISINPNPFQDRLYIQLPEATSFQYILTDMTGRMIKQQYVEATNFNEIDSSTLATGVYVLTIKTKDGKILVRKIVKQ